MNIAPIIYDLLRVNTDLRTYVNGKIYPNNIPQNTTYPAITHSIDTVSPVRTKDGYAGIDEIIAVVTHIFSDFATGKSMADLVRDILDDKSGVLSGFNVMQIVFIDQTDIEYLEDIEAHTITQRFEFKVRA